MAAIRRSPKRALIAGLVATLAATASADMPMSGPAVTRIDPRGPEPNVPGDSMGGASGVFVIDDLRYGTRPGGDGPNLFFGFDHFDLREGDTARFTADSGIRTENVLAHVGGGEASQIFGRLESTIGGADFFFLNPHGVVFGPDATIDLPASFFVSTADFVEFADGTRWGGGPADAPVLAMQPPMAFGFLGGPVEPILIDGSQLALERTAPDRPGFDLSLIGGDLTIRGGGGYSEETGFVSGAGFIDAAKGSVRLVSVASEGTVRLSEQGPGVELDGFTELGHIRIVDDAVVSTSAFAVDALRSVGTEDAPLRELGLDGLRLLREDLVEEPGPFDVVGSFEEPSEFGVPVLSPSNRPEVAGSIVVRGRSLSIVDSDLRAVTLGRAGNEAGGIDVELTGPLSIARVGRPKDVGLIARSGLDVYFELDDPIQVVFDFAEFPAEDPGAPFAAVLGAGDGGDISVRAGGAEISGGGVISTTSLGPGKAGAVTLDLADGDFVASGKGSTVFSNAQGTGDAGDITFSNVSRLELSDGAEVIAQTTRDGRAGDISIGARQVVLRDDAQIDSSTSGQFLAEGDPGFTTGDGGNVKVTATESITITGREGSNEFTGLSTFSRARSSGRAGDITVVTPRLEIRDGGGISVTSEGEAGEAGNIAIDTASLSLTNGAEISAESSATRANLPALAEGETRGSIQLGVEDGTHRLGDVLLDRSTVSAFAAEGPPPPPAGTPPDEVESLRTEGRISVLASGVVELSDSRLAASVGEGLGGSIRIGQQDGIAPQGVVLRDSEILAETEDGQGGRIEINSGVILADPESRISADAGVGEPGEVILNSPVTQVEGNNPQLNAVFLDAAEMLRPACAARASGEIGSFSVARSPGLPASPEGLLVAFDDLAVGGSLPPVAAGAGRSPDARTAQASLAEGEVLIRGGRSEEAEAVLTRAWALAQQDSDPGRASDALRGVAQALQVQGRYAESVPPLQEALRLAEESQDPARVASVLGSLGNAHLALGDEERAEALLTRGLAVARRSDRPGVAATLHNNLGNQQASLGRHAQALRSYREAAALAETAGRPLQQSIALSNAARSALEQNETDRARALLSQARTRQASLAGGQASVYVGIHLAKSYERLASVDPAHRDAHLRAGHAALSAALQAATALGDERALSYALGNLGSLYEAEHRVDEALFLTRRALAAARAAEAADALYRWHWQEGRLLWSRGKATAALAAYRRAVEVLDETRQETRDQYGSAALAFRRAVAPVYRDYVEALLASSDLVTDADAARSPRRQLLVEARATMERFKAAELRDYFRDECVAEIESRQRDLDRVAQSRGRVAVVYPIVLPERLELLVSLPGGLERYRVSVPASELEATVARFRRDLTNRTSPRGWRRSGGKLHDWLVAPYADALVDQQVSTLVFVPDGALRTVPMAALWDGEAPLVRRYALAVTPGLSLTDPRPLDPTGARFLLAGVSEARDGFEELQKVPEELAAIQAIYGGRVLLDDEFEAERFEAEVATQEPSVVHVASHAVFTGDPRTSFVLAYDSRLSLDRMAEVVAPAQYREQPLELLVLSACETAAGDERAALGMAGVALRAGARSAVGSLWAISDDATYRLMVDFYEALKQPDRSKAEALRTAQLALLDTPAFDHPYYWSAFVVMSNWM